jgi:site-specific recombinase XerD
MLIFYDNGIRLSELRLIKIDDIDFENKTIKVMGKGRRERYVPITVHTRKHIIRYIKGARLKLCPDNSPYLFANCNGEVITKNSVQQFMRRLMQKSGLKGIKLTPHIIRHSFSTQYLSNGGSIDDLQKILGHKSIMTTLRYIQTQRQDIQKRHSKFSPIADLFRNKP